MNKFNENMTCSIYVHFMYYMYLNARFGNCVFGHYRYWSMCEVTKCYLTRKRALRSYIIYHKCDVVRLFFPYKDFGNKWKPDLQPPSQ